MGQESLKLKNFTVGPTTHVLKRSPLTSVLWHPCGVFGSCLVSITNDPVIRLWELDPKNRWSFDRPSLAIDLKKLAKGQTSQDDFSPTRDSNNHTFSAENVDLDIASACFGGVAGKHEDAWSAMTLWIATKFGTVYALCPLIPSKWCSSIRALRSLVSSTSLTVASLKSDESASGQEVQQARDQLKWGHDLDEQEPRILSGKLGTERTEVYHRPDILGAVPKLQGPFTFSIDESEEDVELSDIYVIPARSDEAELADGLGDADSDLVESPAPSLSSSLVCLISRVGRVYVCLDLQGVEAQWLPQKSSTFTVPDEDEEVLDDHFLTPFEVLDTLNPEDADDLEWSTITPDIFSSEAFFITHSRGIHYLSFVPWSQKLQDELQSDSPEGLTTRIDVIRNSTSTLREQILTFKSDLQDGFDSSPSAPVLMQDSDLGYLLLTVQRSAPHLALFDTPASATQQPFIKPDPDSSSPDAIPFQDLQLSISGSQHPSPHPRREVYIPPANFSTENALPRYLNSQSSGLPDAEKNKQLRLSSATLATLSSIHRTTSAETAELGTSVADLFVACHRLQEGLRDQIQSVRDLKDRISHVVGNDSDHYAGHDGVGGTSEEIEDRVDRAKLKQEELVSRLDALRRNVSKLGGRGKGLSRGEEKWVKDIRGLAEATLGRKGMEEIGEEDAESQADGESEEDDHMLPHMRAKAKPEDVEDPSSSSSSGEDIDNGEEDIDDESPLQRKITSQSLKARHTRAQELAHVLRSQIPPESSSSFRDSTASYVSTMSNGTNANGYGDGLHIPRDMKRRRMREIMALLDRETALVDVTMGRLERLKAATASS